MAHKEAFENLSPSDERILRGFEDPALEEEEQIIPPILGTAKKSEEDQNKEGLIDIKNRAAAILKRIDGLKKEIDARCENLNVNVIEENEEDGDNELLQAMWRVFKEKTTVITYNHYKKALELRAQLARDDEERLKKL